MKIPSLRFPGFKGEWELKAIKNIASINPKSDKLPASFVYIDLESVSNGILTKEETICLKNAPSRAQRLLNNEDVLFQLVRPYQKNNFYFDKGDGFVASTGYAQIRAKCSSRFLFHYLHVQSFVNKVIVRCTGTSYPAINSEDLSKIHIHLPTLPEQKKIASFLTAVDERIQRLSRKKTLLEQYKKGVMQKIFSRKIRFKPAMSGAEGDDKGRDFPEWEEIALKQVISEFIVPMRDKPTDLKGEIPWCRIEDFNGKYLYGSKSNQGVSLTTVKLMNLKIYPINTLLVSCSANLGFCAITKTELISNQTFIGLVPNTAKANVEFLYYLMSLSSKRLNILSSGTTISYLSREQFEEFKVEFPSLPEQQKIASFLSSIDKKIDLVNTQLEKTREWKKGLLQKMFV